MFSERNRQVDQAYIQTSEYAIDTAFQLAKMLKLLAEALKETWDKKQEEDKIAVKVGEETYNLVEDKDTPGAYNWEKVDLNNDTSEVEQPFTDYQAQTLATKIITEAPSDSIEIEYPQTDNPAIQVVLLDKEKTVLYELSSEGKCVKNVFIEELGQEKIIDVAYVPISNILPENSPLLLPPGKDDIETHKDLSISADDMLSQVVDESQEKQPSFDADGLIVEEPTEETKPATIETTPQKVSQPSLDADSLIVEKTTPTPVETVAPEIDQPSFDNDGLIVEEVINQPKVQKFDNDGLIVEETNSTITQDDSANKTANLNTATFIAGTTASEVTINSIDQPSPVIDESLAIEKVNTQVEKEFSPIVKSTTAQIQEEFTPIVRKTKTQSEEEPSANYTYREVASSPEVEPQAQQWAKQSTIPIEKIKHRGERNKVELENNQNIANTATEMLKKYGTIEPDGSRIYRSDAFAIRKAEGVVSIHRRGDEAKGFKESLIEFKLDKKGVPDIKGTNLFNNLTGSATRNEMNPVEKQEFLIVAEQLNEGKSLPDLQAGDVRETGNALGSLAPAGTLKTLEAFKKTEMLEMLNSTLNQVKSDEVKTGEFTIKRSRDPENNRASLVLTKDGEDGKGTKELVRFNLEKTPDGIKSEVAKMNISDYDIGQVKHIAQNAYKLDNKNLESNFDTEKQTEPLPQQTNSNIQPEVDTKNVGDIPIEVHPWIAEEWQKMAKEKPLWAEVVGQDNDEILQKLEQNEGKLPIAEQREMYDKIMMHKVPSAGYGRSSCNN